MADGDEVLLWLLVKSVRAYTSHDSREISSRARRTCCRFCVKAGRTLDLVFSDTVEPLSVSDKSDFKRKH